MQKKNLDRSLVWLKVFFWGEHATSRVRAAVSARRRRGQIDVRALLHDRLELKVDDTLLFFLCTSFDDTRLPCQGWKSRSSVLPTARSVLPRECWSVPQQQASASWLLLFALKWTWRFNLLIILRCLRFWLCFSKSRWKVSAQNMKPTQTNKLRFLETKSQFKHPMKSMRISNREISVMLRQQQREQQLFSDLSPSHRDDWGRWAIGRNRFIGGLRYFWLSWYILLRKNSGLRGITISFDAILGPRKDDPKWSKFILIWYCILTSRFQ